MTILLKYIIVISLKRWKYLQVAVVNPGAKVVEKLQRANMLESFGGDCWFVSVREAIYSFSSLLKIEACWGQGEKQEILIILYSVYYWRLKIFKRGFVRTIVHFSYNYWHNYKVTALLAMNNSLSLVQADSLNNRGLCHKIFCVYQ